MALDKKCAECGGVHGDSAYYYQPPATACNCQSSHPQLGALPLLRPVTVADVLTSPTWRGATVSPAPVPHRFPHGTFPAWEIRLGTAVAWLLAEQPNRAPFVAKAAGKVAGLPLELEAQSLTGLRELLRSQLLARRAEAAEGRLSHASLGKVTWKWTWLGGAKEGTPTRTGKLAFTGL